MLTPNSTGKNCKQVYLLMHVKRVSVDRSKSVTCEVQYQLDVDLKDSDAAHKGTNYNTDLLSLHEDKQTDARTPGNKNIESLTAQKLIRMT